jgi:hypothetical protein
MGLLRDRLKETSPQLYAALERSWEIALNEWLPAIGMQRDSFNSYPHLRNLEIYLDKLAAAYEARPTSEGQALLLPAELYVMLASILFHDIGRIRKGEHHGEKSGKIIEKEHAALGIVSEEMAHTIAKVCEFHDLSAKKARDKMSQLSIIVVDPYGSIRERCCAALLMLIDHIDGTFTRSSRLH